MLPLFRAVLVWAAVLIAVTIPRLAPPQPAPQAPIAVTQVSSYDRQSVIEQTRNQRVQAAQTAQVLAWSAELKKGIAEYEAQQEALAAAEAEAARVAALNNHPPPPPAIAKIITDAFSPLGQPAVVWAMRIAYCESRYHPNSVNSTSHASGLFQFLPSTWSGTPWAAQSPFDPVANAQAAAWLYNRYGPGRWACK